MSLLNYPILVVSYAGTTRSALVEHLKDHYVESVSCSSFREAEDHAVQEIFSGMLVDLPSMIKAKGEEKIIACSLTGLYPTLRVRSLGALLVPMTVQGGSQDSSLGEFIAKTCVSFSPRRLRVHQRHKIAVPALLRHNGSEKQSFTMNISWGGAFMVDTEGERFRQGEEVELYLPEFELTTNAEICWKEPWGTRRAPGIGVRFLTMEGLLETVLSSLLKTDRDKDRARLVIGSSSF